jgi:hypothetical protein
MAGLAHNPLALNCIKRAQNEDNTGRVDISAVCPLCEKRNPELMKNLVPPANGEDPAAELAAELGSLPKPPDAGNVSDERPPIARFLERIGIVQGARLGNIRLSGGHTLDKEYRVVDVAAFMDAHDVVLTLQEDGLTGQVVVRYLEITAFSNR